MRRHPTGRSLGGALSGAFFLALIIGLPTARVATAADPVACVSETGTAGLCVDGTALDGATGVIVSPDGASVYAASETSRSVSIFSQDRARRGQISRSSRARRAASARTEPPEPASMDGRWSAPVASR